MARVALLIGVSDYGPGFNWIPGVVKDLEAMQRILQNPDLGGFSCVQTLKNPDPQTMHSAIARTFKEKVSDQDDLVLLFFSGHCVNDHHNQLYFATRHSCKNSQGELVKSTAVPATVVQDIMNDSCSKQQVVILDTCFSKDFIDVWSSDCDYVDVKNQLGGEGRVVLSATTSTQEITSHKGFELSSYTSYLVEGIETGIADFDRDQCVSAYELHQYISKKAQQSSVTLQPTICTVGESYNIGLTKAPIQNIEHSNQDTTVIYADAASIGVSDVTNKDDSLHKLATKPFDLNSIAVRSQIPKSKKPKLLFRVGLAGLLLLAGIIYSFTRTQDLRHLTLGGTIAADTNYKNQIPTVFEHRNTVWSLAFSPDSQLLASSSGDKTIKVWQLKNKELLRAFPGAHLDTIWSVVISPDGQTLISASGDKTVKIWNLKTGELLRTLVGHTDTVRSVAISANGQIVASGATDNTVKVWNLKTGQLLHSLGGHTGRIISIAISPDGKTIASGGNDNKIKLWNLRTGALLHTLSGHTNHVNSIAFRADGKLLVSGAEDHLIKLWNPQTGELLHTITRHDEDVYAIAISPDGKMLASGDKDGEIKLGY